jgi:hypothetical protein
VEALSGGRAIRLGFLADSFRQEPTLKALVTDPRFETAAADSEDERRSTSSER